MIMMTNNSIDYLFILLFHSLSLSLIFKNIFKEFYIFRYFFFPFCSYYLVINELFNLHKNDIIQIFFLYIFIYMLVYEYINNYGMKK